MSSIKDLLKDLKTDDMPARSFEKKEDRKKACEKCGKILSSYCSLWRHNKICTSGYKRTLNLEPKTYEKSVKVQADHKRRIPILKLKWNGSKWQRDTSCEKWYYQMKLGRDLDNLIQKRAINEEVLNTNQKSYLQMYREMFTD